MYRRLVPASRAVSAWQGSRWGCRRRRRRSIGRGHAAHNRPLSNWHIIQSPRRFGLWCCCLYICRKWWHRIRPKYVKPIADLELIVRRQPDELAPLLPIVSTAHHHHHFMWHVASAGGEQCEWHWWEEEPCPLRVPCLANKEVPGVIWIAGFITVYQLDLALHALAIRVRDRQSEVVLGVHL